MQYYKVVRVNPKNGKLVSSYASAKCKRIDNWSDYNCVSFPLLVYVPGQITKAYRGSPGIFICHNNLERRMADVYKDDKYQNCEVRLYPIEIIGKVNIYCGASVCPAIKMALEPVKIIKIRNGISFIPYLDFLEST